ncbi:MAG TPA: hypothetical protein VLL08_29640 [Kineosporiaceae bacterium]|nr:hypothetical protein [Kineosporiaceae bacterium]
MQSNWRRAVLRAVTVPTAVAVLSGCGALPGSHPVTYTGTAAPAGGISTSPVAAAPTATGTDSTAEPGDPPTKVSAPATAKPVTKPCTAGGAAIPNSANGAQTADLDGDGKRDIIWLGIKGNARMLGVQTASGARFAVSFTHAGKSTAAALAGRLGDGTAVILLDFSQEVKLYAVLDCAIVPVSNTQGKQYTFDEGVTGFGTGVGCPLIGASRHLVGFLAKPGGAGDGYIVTRTMVNLSEGGTRALNGTVKTLATGVPSSNPLVKKAQAVTCGAGKRALEPAA